MSGQNGCFPAEEPTLRDDLLVEGIFTKRYSSGEIIYEARNILASPGGINVCGLVVEGPRKGELVYLPLDRNRLADKRVGLEQVAQSSPKLTPGEIQVRCQDIHGGELTLILTQPINQDTIKPDALMPEGYSSDITLPGYVLDIEQSSPSCK